MPVQSKVSKKREPAGGELGVRSVPIERFLGDAPRKRMADAVAVEEPLEIRIEGRSVAVVMRTPGHDRELAAGFLLSEGVIRSARDLFEIVVCPGAGEGTAVDVTLRDPSRLDLTKLTRHLFTSSSCGVCSRASLDAVLGGRKRLSSGLRVRAANLRTWPAKLREAQETFASTGGLHGCALFDAEGGLVMAREDVGRHNALDKLVGWALLNGKAKLGRHVLLLSGRSSFELLQKAYMAGIPFVAGIGAPSSLAVDFARESGQTLVGFLKEQSCNAYSGGHRLV
jgi:FdhD protein